MSYNISTWHTKTLDDLRISHKALVKSNKWDGRIIDYGEHTWLFVGEAEGARIEGTEKDEHIVVSFIQSWGEGSGWLHDAFKNLLAKHSTGLLEAILIWEEGDSISKLCVRDGDVQDTKIDLDTL